MTRSALSLLTTYYRLCLSATSRAVLLVAFVSTCMLQPAIAAPLDCDEQLLKDLNLPADDASLIKLLRERCAPPHGPERITELIRKMGSNRFAEREEATQELKRIGRFAVSELHEAARSSDPDMAKRATECLKFVENGPSHSAAQSAIRLLVKRHVKEAANVLVEYSPAADGEEAEVEVYYGMDDLIQRQGSIPPALRTALKDKEPARRALAACLLAWRGSAEERAAAQRCLEDRSPLVRLRAAQGMLAAHDKSGLPVLIRLLSEPDVTLSWQAEELLHWAAGDTSPASTVGAATPKEREQCRVQWGQWYAKHARTIVLKERGRSGRRPGLLLVSDSGYPETEKGARQLWLHGCDGKARWKWEMEGGVTDMLLLPGNKLLLAEEKLTQRDLQGKVVWREDVRVTSIHSQSNGTFFAIWGEHLNTQTFELDYRGKKLLTYPVIQTVKAGSDWFNAELGVTKLANGRLGFLDRMTRTLVECDAGKAKDVPREATRVFKLPLKGGVLVPNSGFLLPGQWFVLGGMEDGSPWKLHEVNTMRGIHRTPNIVDSVLTRVRNGNLVVAFSAFNNGQLAVLAEYDRQGRTVWEDFPTRAVNRTKICLPLVRFGFDLPAAAPEDLASVENRIKGLRDKAPVVRVRSAQMLGRSAGQSKSYCAKAEGAMPTLFEALEGLEGSQWIEVASLGRVIKGPNSITLLTQRGNDKDEKTREWARFLLWDYEPAPQEGLQFIVESMKFGTTEHKRTARFRARLFTSDRAVVTALVEILKDKYRPRFENDCCPAYDAADSLGTVRGELAQAAIPALLDVVGTGDTRMKIYARGSLAWIARDDKEAATRIIPVFLQMLKKSKDITMRAHAASFFSSLGPSAKAAVPALREALAHPGVPDGNPEAITMLRQCVVEAIWRLGPAANDATPELINLLKDQKSNNGLRKLVAHALGAIGPAAKAALPTLRTAASDEGEDYAVRSAAEIAIRAIQP